MSDDLSYRDHGFGTRCVHAGQEPDPATGAVMTPVYFTSTFAQSAPNVHKGYDYSRADHPTRRALEGNLASLEGARHGVAFASGLGAMDAILKRLVPGDHVVATNDLYGGSFRLFTKVFQPFGIDFSFVDMRDTGAVEAAMTERTKMVWIETPTNPLLRVVDIAALVALAQSKGAWSVVDNTFASPALQQPLALGADVVVHSATKYLGGHSDVILGVAVTDDDDWHEHLRFQVKATGACPGPMDCFLVLRGTKTLHLRMERHCESAARIAEHLAAHPAVAEVYYPGLAGHDGHAIAARQMAFRGRPAFGGMLSFVLADDTVEAAERVVTATELFTLAESLGGVESLIEHPASMTHASIPEAERTAAGYRNSLIRLSVGVEDVDDLIADLDRALGG